MVYFGKRTHGATASDPFAYAQMGVDLAERDPQLAHGSFLQPLDEPGAEEGLRAGGDPSSEALSSLEEAGNEAPILVAGSLVLAGEALALAGSRDA